MVFAEFNGRGRIETVELPIEWIDPISISIESPGPLVAGKKNVIVARVDRAGDDPQPVTIKFPKLPAGVTGPESVNVAADAEQAEIELELSADVGGKTAEIEFKASSTYHGNDFSITGKSLSLSLVSTPARLEAFPAEVTLVGKQARRQIVITGYDTSESPRDWTRDVTFNSANSDVAEVRGAVVYPKANGETEIIVELGEITVDDSRSRQRHGSRRQNRVRIGCVGGIVQTGLQLGRLPRLTKRQRDVPIVATSLRPQTG